MSQNSPPPELPEVGILPKKYPDLHTSFEVEAAVRQSDERILNDPASRISVYLSRLLGREDASEDGGGHRHGLLGGERRDEQIASHVIEPSEVPEGYWERERLMRHERGQDDRDLTDDEKLELARAIITDQTKSLERWVDYFSESADMEYPVWFKYYVIRSALKMADFDKNRGSFRKRSKGTASPFPELNQEALAYTFGALDRSMKGIEIEDGEVAKLAKGANFSKLYGHFYEQSTSVVVERARRNDGQWKKYNQTGDYGADEGYDSYYWYDSRSRAAELSGSLRGYNTGWCTAEQGTAAKQLEGGDFYVFYSYDEDSEATIPRIAIRMDNGRVAEVRGIGPNQQMESAMLDTAQDKFETLPGGREYQQKVDDMKRMTEIERKLNSGEGLDGSELRFLYEMDGTIMSFGYGADPRIEEIRSQRIFDDDLETIFGTRNHSEVVLMLLEEEYGISYVANNLSVFKGLNQHVAEEIIKNHWWASEEVAKNIGSFSGLDYMQVAKMIIDSGSGEEVVKHLDKFESLNFVQLADWLIEAGKGDSVADRLNEFKGVNRRELVERLFETGCAGSIASNLEKFDGVVDHQELIDRLMDIGAGWRVARNLYKFKGIDQEKLVERFFESDDASEILIGLKFLTDIDQADVIKRLFAVADLDENDRYDNIERMVLAQLQNTFGSFGRELKNLDSQIALRLLENGDFDAVGIIAQSLDSFTGLSEEVARKIVEGDWGFVLIKHLDVFDSLDANRAAKMLTDAGHNTILMSNLEKYSNLESQIAYHLAGTGKNGKMIIEHMDVFEELDQEKLVAELIQSGQGEVVIDSLDKLTEINRTWLLKKLAYETPGYMLMERIDKFDDIDYGQLMNWLIEAGNGSTVLYSLEVFEEKINIDYTRLAERLVKVGAGWDVAQYITKLKGVNHTDIANKIIEAGELWGVYEFLDLFTELDPELADEIREEGKKLERELYEDMGVGMEDEETYSVH